MIPQIKSTTYPEKPINDFSNWIKYIYQLIKK